MREYLLYTSLVFLPIAAVIFYILKSYRLSYSAIWAILVLTFVIIITFPFSIIKIGSIFTLVVYIIVLGGITLYLLQYDAEYSLETDKNRKEKIEIYGCEIVESQFPEPGKIQMLLAGKNEFSGAEIGSEKPEFEALKNEVERVNDDNVMGIDEERKVEEEYAIVENEKICVYEETKEAAMIAEPTKQINGDTTWFSEEKGTEAGYCEREIASEKDRGGEKEIEKEDEKTGITDAESEESGYIEKEKDMVYSQVVRFLDLAFKAKMNEDFEEAFVYFRKAWELTGDIDLKYMLTLEMADISIILGWYSQGEEIIVKCMNEYVLNETMRRELARKLAFIQLIRREIRYLKLEEVPFARLPRLLKVKVEDELRRLYT
ncbi:hypothetical protein SAMN02745221_01018 [Thermosyntropha lipolytica DSM 11003]|uniref:Uncharacterized protein n=1 Tax=Thermosyntropha lipolytica DSM 11003 TaxID=1123382 RepID=A0A1M5MU02_9FIRM|nr:hypothetical protein [Thermosyntropha lipolytica]SHG80778.1 hypothetical protein SAMN02745221_01018 [Thermosyntropha lipolytica DSM 11003]